jgi:hypothetical protein
LVAGTSALVMGALSLGLTPIGAGTDAGAAPATTTDSGDQAVGHGSIEQAYELGAPPGASLSLENAQGRVVVTGVADRYGSLIVRNVAPGSGYRFVVRMHSTTSSTAPFRVLNVHDTPPQSFYADQHLHEGLNYIEMRDGILLAATVRLPPGKTLADGPFPTVIEDSGYAIAAPHSLIDALLNPSSAPDPLLPDTATIVGSVLAPLLGFATVSLQMRGTGCSGGAFDLFGLPTTYDGYDAVETVAAQPWSLGHRVGLVRISFSGISQLFVAGTRPPDLAAIAPLSVTDDLYSTGYPGGIHNEGFAAGWIAQRVADAQPAPAGGEPYARALIADGDTSCLANQRLRLQTQNADALMKANRYRVPALFDQRAPAAWASRIDVPVFLVGALEDEQTGPQWPALIPALAHDPDVWVTMLNGAHVDSLGPATITRWLEFLDIFVADQVPTQPAVLQALSGAFYQRLAGTAAAPLPPVRFTHAPSAAAARSMFEHEDPRVRVLFDNGGS